MTTPKCVVVCVTQQPACERLINAGKKIAEEKQLPLEVLNIQPRKDSYSPNPEAMELLYRSCRSANARMSVYFNDEPAFTAASLLKKLNAAYMVSGFPEGDASPFIAQVHMILPELPILMVDASENIYHMLTHLPENVLLPKRV